MDVLVRPGQETFEATARFIDALKIPYIGPSLGGVETLIEQVPLLNPCRMTRPSRYPLLDTP